MEHSEVLSKDKEQMLQHLLQWDMTETSTAQTWAQHRLLVSHIGLLLPNLQIFFTKAI